MKEHIMHILQNRYELTLQGVRKPLKESTELVILLLFNKKK